MLIATVTTEVFSFYSSRRSLFSLFQTIV